MALPKAMTLTERLRYRSLWKRLRGEFSGELARLEDALRENCAGIRRPLPEAARQLIDSGGKRVRPLLAWLSASALGARPELADPVALAAELTHAATLLHDDVLDEGVTRRGVPAARVLHGNRIAILAGDFLLTRALEAVRVGGESQVMGDYLGALQHMVEGEVLQQQSRFDLGVTEETYREIVSLKTAALFAWSARAGGALAGGDGATVDALERFGRRIGSAFQILDDWLDWVGEGAVVGKAVRSDLREGKPSLAVIYGCEMSEPVRRWFTDHLREDAPYPDEKEVARLAGELASCGALARVREALESETAAALAELEVLPDSLARSQLARFARLLVARDR